MSIAMAITLALLRRRARTTETVESMLATMATRTEPAEPNAAIYAVANVEFTIDLGCMVYRLTPKKAATGVHLLYLPGGAYVYPLKTVHWSLLARLIKRSGVTVTLVLYGLAPEHTVQQALAMLDDVYAEVAAEARSSKGRVYLAGDSAGGGLAVALAMRLRDAGAPQPAGVILFSPWLDVTMSNPAVPGLAQRDPMLGPVGLEAAGRWWAGDLDPRASEVSPAFGELAGLPAVHVFQGGNDVLAADATEFSGAVNRAGGESHLVFEKGAFHVYVGAPWTPEARRALRSVETILGRTA